MPKSGCERPVIAFSAAIVVYRSEGASEHEHTYTYTCDTERENSSPLGSSTSSSHACAEGALALSLLLCRSRAGLCFRRTSPSARCLAPYSWILVTAPLARLWMVACKWTPLAWVWWSHASQGSLPLPYHSQPPRRPLLSAFSVRRLARGKSAQW